MQAQSRFLTRRGGKRAIMNVDGYGPLPKRWGRMHEDHRAGAGEDQLSLDVCAGRDDGYHELDMLMHTRSRVAHLRARPLSDADRGRRTLSEGGRNLVLQAAQALNAHMGRHYGARITLAKHIPIRAGLGGGSADCAATLIALDRLWGLRLPMQELLKIGRKLGADVPYCIAGGFARVRGMGEKITPLGEGERFPLVLLHVGCGLSTAQVFSEYDRVGGTLGLDNAAPRPGHPRPRSGRHGPPLRQRSGSALHIADAGDRRGSARAAGGWSPRGAHERQRLRRVRRLPHRRRSPARRRSPCPARCLPGTC